MSKSATSKKKTAPKKKIARRSRPSVKKRPDPIITTSEEPPTLQNQPAFRKLKGYAFDPSFASTIERRQTNQVIYKVRWEQTSAGPCGSYIDIIDFDPTKECFYEPIKLDDSVVLADQGLEPTEGDPMFHQQQVYAVVMTVIEQFEKALGRKLIWSKLFDKDDSGNIEYEHRFIPTLRIYPHALRQQNAFYSPTKLALLFGYFQAEKQFTGNNVPGSAIFTCLSPDIVAHETTHAILDSILPYLKKDTNLDMPAFHEGFADIIALLQRFSFASVVEEQIRNSRGDLLSPQNLLGDLAIQFGQAISGNRKALRSFLVEKDEKGNFVMIKPDPEKYKTETEPHLRGGLLVAAVFDAFARLYKYRVADLIRLATGGSGILEQGEIGPDLVKRLSAEACDISNKLMLICIRALDYCPPADLTFGDYLRAMITADIEHNPDDEDGLRYALLEAFRSWGIIPENINTYSVESLKWKPIEEFFENWPQIPTLKKIIRHLFHPDKVESNNPVIRSMERILREEDRKSIFDEASVLAEQVHHQFNRKLVKYEDNLEQLLGMCFQPLKYYFYDEVLGQQVELKAPMRQVFQVYKCRPLMQFNPRTGKTSKLLIITFLQKVYVQLANTPFEGYFEGDKYDYRGGATLVIDLATFDIHYAIVKKITSADRLRQQLDYRLTYGTNGDAALLMQEEEPFAALHIH